ncbi:ISL3 family transposase [Streptacidiphilus sp. P02-A3a]|uniref:ISL3 family transposase n=1 Tax=Streptacidiphilus sp. P02-A3a TaxID=2704468 RepID=UPI0015FE223A|nr:ISL3 family transposase [Streptacidiphilus sp. P02-A3a]
MFSGLSALVVEDVVDDGESVRVVARTPDGAVPCPVCGTPAGRVRSFHGRTVTDAAVDGRRVVVEVRVRRLVCPVLGCPRQTFREQVPSLLGRYQRRTNRLAAQPGSVVAGLAGRASSRPSRVLAIAVSRSTALRMLMRLPLPLPLPLLQVPRAIGVDDFAPRRRHRCATIIIDAETGRRIDVLPHRPGATLTTWSRAHPGVEIVCRDGPTAYAEAIRTALPDAARVSDRRHVRKNFREKALTETRGHAPRWATRNPSLPGGIREQTTLERWHKVHNLTDQGVGLPECSRRPNLALNTVKRYARRPRPPAERIVPRHRPTLVDPYRDHPRTRREQNPALPVTQLFREIKERGYAGGLNLPYRYLNQGRAEGTRPVTTPQHAARLLLTRPENPRSKDTELRDPITAACPQTTALANPIATFAALPTPAAGNDTKLTDWISHVRAADLPHPHSFRNGPQIDRAAVNAAPTPPWHNGRTEGVNTRTKRITRQTHGRAGLALPRHHILLH